MNKWDLAPFTGEVGQAKYEDVLRTELNFFHYVPVLFSSVKSNWQVDKVMDTAVRVAKERKVKIATKILIDMIATFVVHWIRPLTAKSCCSSTSTQPKEETTEDTVCNTIEYWCKSETSLGTEQTGSSYLRLLCERFGTGYRIVCSFFGKLH